MIVRMGAGRQVSDDVEWPWYLRPFLWLGEKIRAALGLSLDGRGLNAWERGWALVKLSLLVLSGGFILWKLTE